MIVTEFDREHGDEQRFFEVNISELYDKYD